MQPWESSLTGFKKGVGGVGGGVGALSGVWQSFVVVYVKH